MAQAYTVSQITGYIRNLFSRDFVLGRVTVSGEISNCKYHIKGHIYFTLKDSGAEIRCVMFAGNREGLLFELRDGQQVEVTGQISVYEKSGSYQLYARKIDLSGAGALYEKYLRLKSELESMGMFDAIYKKPIPAYCMSIGIVTAAGGAALRDIISVSRRRNPYVRLVLSPAQVQGEGAGDSIVRGIERLDRENLDVIIVGRGGGSIEDLWAFNEKAVAEAIFDAGTPVISAVGHETDFTIADFVADLRAPTPSAAAELANFVYSEFDEELSARHDAMKSVMIRRVSDIRKSLVLYGGKIRAFRPDNVIKLQKAQLTRYEERMRNAAHERIKVTGRRLEDLSRGIVSAMSEKLDSSKRTNELYAARLDGMSPLKKISGGSGYLVTEGKKAVRSIRDVSAGDKITAYLSDGSIESKVTSVREIKGIFDSGEKNEY